MKQTFYYLLLSTLFIGKLNAQSFTLHLKQTTTSGNIVRLRLPIEDIFFLQNTFSDTLTNGNYDLNMPIQQPCFLTINQLKIYAEPNKHLEIDYDYEKNKIVYSGDLQLENTILRRYRLDMNSINALVKDFSTKDKTPQAVYNEVMTERDKELNYLETACSTNTVSPNFLRLVRWDIMYAYACVFDRICSSANFNKEERRTILTPEWEIFNKKNRVSLPISNEEAVACESYWIFTSSYFYTEMKPYPNGIAKRTCAEMNNIPQLLKQKFSGKVYKMLFTEIFHSLAYQNEICVLPQCELFKQEYPDSPLIPFLEKMTTKLYALVEANKKDLSANIHIIDTFQMDTIAQLFEKFKGKVIFGDIWATWCGPCKEEFAHKTELEAFAEKNGIISLFISIDKAEKEALWKTMVKRYDLKGYNILLNTTLYEQLKRLLFSSNMVTIPRYFIIDKTGKIVVYDAKRPSEKEELFKQLRVFLE
jgi:thiol-disulfide isomerase/thioredoxin